MTCKKQIFTIMQSGEVAKTLGEFQVGVSKSACNSCWLQNIIFLEKEITVAGMMNQDV